MAQKIEVMKSLSIINDDIDKITQTYPSLGITATDSPKTIFDKVIGHTEISKNVFNLLGNIFNYTEFIRMAVQDVNTANTENVSNYVMNWITYGSQLAGPAKKFIDNGVNSGLLSKIPVLSAKNLVSIAARGVIVGVLTDMSYKAGYAFGERIWNKKFEEWYGVTATEYYADDFEAIYSTIFQHLTGNELNAVIAFNTMILGNFINQQRESVILNDSIDLFGAADYQSMDFKKALTNYQKLYKAVTGQNDAESINDVASMIAHMEKSYPLFKELRGIQLLILANEQNQHLLGKADSIDAIGIVIRYALQQLNPFVLIGDKVDYSQLNRNGELDLYSPQNPNGMTETYIQKRIEMLKILIENNTSLSLGDLSVLSVGINHSPYYQDLSSKITASLEQGEPIGSRIIFGTDQADTEGLEGALEDDYLFGGMGEDTLKGKKGND